MSRSRSAAARAVAPLAIVVAVFVVPVAVLVISTWFQGRQLQIVESGSMEPTYPVGSALVVDPVRPSQVEVGDALVFADPERGGALVTHRVIHIRTTDGLRQFRTQGDANRSMDLGWVEATEVRGVVVRSVPGLGRFLHLTRWPTSAVLLVGLPLALLVADVVLGRRPADEEPAGVPAEVAPA